jgi:beta-glucosidase
LSYTKFDYANLKVEGGDGLTVSFDVRNSGKTAGRDVPQIYLTDAAGKAHQRLIGWSSVELQPGAMTHFTYKTDARLVADFDETAHNWHVAPGRYQVALGASATDLRLRAAAELNEGRIKP